MHSTTRYVNAEPRIDRAKRAYFIIGCHATATTTNVSMHLPTQHRVAKKDTLTTPKKMKAISLQIVFMRVGGQRLRLRAVRFDGNLVVVSID